MPSAPADTAHAEIAAQPRPVRVIVVDDQAVFRDAARALVGRTHGFELVGESRDGDGALELAQRVDPDMVLVDVRLVGMDGVETARGLTAQDASRVIVLVSSADLHELSALAGESGASALVNKHWLTPRFLRGLWVAHRQR
jgi:DNA-binding NarL/FixJ family response regulator